MRFIVLVKACKESEAGVMPSRKDLETMGAFNEELVKAGVMLAGDGLHPSSKAARVRLTTKAAPVVVDGPFAETKEQLGGFYLYDAANLDEALELAARIPDAKNGSIEVRPLMVFENMP